MISIITPANTGANSRIKKPTTATKIISTTTAIMIAAIAPKTMRQICVCIVILDFR
jgi:hypothetical protein